MILDTRRIGRHTALLCEPLPGLYGWRIETPIGAVQGNYSDDLNLAWEFFLELLETIKCIP
jgi:hypothetical protein